MSLVVRAAAATTLGCNASLLPLSQCSSCSCSVLTIHKIPRHCVLRIRKGRKEEFICRVSQAETEPDNNDEDDKGEENHESEKTESSIDANEQAELPVEQVSTEFLNADSNVVVNSNETDIDGQTSSLQGKDNHETEKSTSTIDSEVQQEELVSAEVSNSDSNVVANNNDTGISDQTSSVQDGDILEVASGSPLPGVKSDQLVGAERMSKETIDILKNQVFVFDTFFTTGQEPYEGGMLFKGNLRGVPSKSYEKMSKRLEDRFGDQYKLFLLINPEDEKPVAVVVPKKTLQPETTALPEWVAAGAFGLVTVFTLLLRNVPALQSNVLSIFDNFDLLNNGFPGALVTALVLASHELGHYIVARNCGVKLGVPYFVPSWQIGSFGAITRIVNIVRNREDLLKISVAGPLAGYALGFLLFLVGFFVPPSDGLGVVVNTSVFHESFLAGGFAKLILGDALKDGQPISLNPLVIWAWAGLLINAINSIPAGELDGGRISFSLWGRKVSSRLSGATIALLGLSSLFNDVAFYWVVLIVILQRGPISPLSEEISDPDPKYTALGIAVLLLGLLVCLPYPFPFTFTGEDLMMSL